MELMTTKEISKQWSISARRVAVLCEEGRLDGVIKKGKTWLIPSNTRKPEDGRYKKMNMYFERVLNLENRYKVVYPESDNATYTSLLNYSDDLNKSFQRWYRYKEGFSVELVEQLIKEYSKHKEGVILDPFSGSGSTLLAANNMGYSGVGFEVNPFSFFLSKCKLEHYTNEIINQFKKEYEGILHKAENTNNKYILPKLSISEKVFNDEVEKYYMNIGVLIENCQADEKVINLLKLGWLACLEPLCNYRKAGNGLKIKKYVKPHIVTPNDAKVMLLEQYQNMYIDLLKSKNEGKFTLYNESCLNMSQLIPSNSIEGIIYSPPYANCFDYTEIYKLELWFGKFVAEYTDLKKLRNVSLHSHLNGDLNVEAEAKSETLSRLLFELQKKELWDKKIPKMLELYYDDMFKVIEESYRVLNDKGFCCIVVGNSAYGGIVFPADLILAEYAEMIGFKVDKIEVDRYIITSSQQYEMTKENSKFLRESIVCLTKNK
ncbi:MAG: DNA adenine methylase [Clostridia bacterium]|nr:DNA adenine methylase [Clostridia bacterium]